jgi:alkylation response protein AidB-like acyl-CoA dehydrogenase
MTELFFLREEAVALTQEARNSLAFPDKQRSRLIHGARAYIIAAARHIGNEAIQMHGGVGITEELPISHYFRRLMVNAAQFGSRASNFDAFLTADTSICQLPA